MSALADRIAALPSEKRLLLERTRGVGPRPVRPGAAEGDGGARPFALVKEADRARLPAGVVDAYPLASVQAGMLFHMHATRDDAVPAYHNVFQFEITTAVDVRLLARAVRRLVARHAILRTSFELTRLSEPLQLVHAEVPVAVPVVDLGGVPDAAARREIAAFVATENRRLLDLRRPPLMRFRLFRRADRRWFLTLTECHAIAEGWSTLITFRELQETYFALLRGEELPPASPPGALYRDFVRLEREALESEECREFWRRCLAGAEVSRLPRWPREWRRARRSTDRKRLLEVPRPVLDGLQRLARELEVPLKSVLLAVHLDVIRTLTGRKDLLTGLQVHGRPEGPDGEHVLGLFVNTLPLRIDLSRCGWKASIRRAFAAERDLLPYRRYPLAALQRQWGREPLIDAAFAFLHFHLFDEHQPWVDSPVRGVDGGDLSVTHFPLVAIFSLREGSPRTLVLWLEHDDSEIPPAQLRAIQRYYGAALRAAAAGGDRSRLLPPDESHRLLLEWNDGGSLADPLPVHRKVRDWARHRPEAVALVGAGEHVTFAELRSRSLELARRLAARGVGPGALVGVHGERRAELVVALLAVLEAGAAFVPLDPDHPAERLEWIARDARLALVLTTGSVEAWGPGVPVIAVRDLEAEGAPPGGWSPPPEDPGALAYVVHTSGSTGRPKGVMVPHAGLANYLAWSVDAYRLAEGRGAPVYSSIAVDLTITSLLAPLWAGTTVRLLPGLLSGRGLDELRALGGDLSLVKATPSHLEMLERNLPGARREGWTRCLVVGGEQLHGEQLAAFRDCVPGLRVVNEYGPTETVVGCAAYELIAGEAPANGPVPIGRPVAGARLYVCDAEISPVPTGAAGELLVGGPGVAVGYLGLPALTAGRFVPDPFGPVCGARLYRTGDLARHRPDGCLDFLGRRDHQVKIRGHRVELGEVEAVLRRHPKVRDAVVAAWGEGPGPRRLVAWIVPRSSEPPPVDDLRGFLLGRLPEVMVPALYVPLDRLPLASGGKVDRAALPAPGAERPGLETGFVPPRSELEAEIAAIWRDVLALEQVGVEDNFFDLGGHSLQLLRVQLKAQEELGRTLTVADVFQYPTVASLAAFLAGEGGPASGAMEDRRAAQTTRRRAAADVRSDLRRRRRAARERDGARP